MDKYKFNNRRGFYAKDVTADIIGNHLNKLYVRHGQIKPDIVVKDAKSDKSPIHTCFEWNDGKAAHEYRLYQARNLIRSVVIKKEGATRDVYVPKFVSVKKEDSSEREYMEIQGMMEDEYSRIQYLRQAYNELLNWKRKYADLEEFAAVFEAIEFLKVH